MAISLYHRNCPMNLFGIVCCLKWQYIGSLANEACHATPKERNAYYQDDCRD